MSGIVSLGLYLPRLRLQRACIAAAMSWRQNELHRHAKGERTLGFWDEDAVTMAVEASRDCLGPCHTVHRQPVDAFYLASSSLPFAEPQNASLATAAIRLHSECATFDISGTPRAALIALHQALEAGQKGLIAAADRLKAAAGSLDEMLQGDGAAAVLVADSGDFCFSYLGGHSRSDPFIDTYREADTDYPTRWEERWVRDEGLLKIMPETVARALERSGIVAGQVDWLVFPSTVAQAEGAVAKACGLVNVRVADSLVGAVGDCGTPQPLLMLAQSSQFIRPGQIVVMAGFGQGATALVFRAEPGLEAAGAAYARAISAGIPEECYTKLPAFSGAMDLDGGFRARGGPSEGLTVAYRYAKALLGFVGGRCRDTGDVVFPPSRLSLNHQKPAIDSQEPAPLADVGGKIASVTQDRLAYSPHPPSCYGLVDFSNGGRLMMEFTDGDANALRSGDDVRFAFRIKDRNSAIGFHRYFWKAVRADPPASHSSTKET
jgi:3-hydroxy-3-methylglutaryl CoA synthase